MKIRLASTYSVFLSPVARHISSSHVYSRTSFTRKYFKKKTKKNSRLLSNHLLLQVIWLICRFVSSRSHKVTRKDQAEERIENSNKNRYSSVISCHISYLHAFLEDDPVRYRFKIRPDFQRSNTLWIHSLTVQILAVASLLCCWLLLRPPVLHLLTDPGQ